MADKPSKKRPASQYYWGDWWKDKALHSCSQPARGLWHEMNCLMHEGEPYGHLTLNGQPMNPAQLANLCRITTGKCKTMLEELEVAGVFSRAETGAIYSRRMVRDEAVRNARADGGSEGAEHGVKGANHGSKGGRPAKNKGGSETPLETPLDDENKGGFKPPPSSSSSSSSSTSVVTAAEACKAMRAVGLADVSPGHPTLLRLLDEGITIEELVSAAEAAVRKQAGMAYALTVAENRRRDAAKLDSLPAARSARNDWTESAV